MARRSKIDGGFIVIPKNTIKSPEYRSLKDYSKAVYSAILTEFIRDNKLNPENKVKITHKQIEHISGTSHSSVVRAMRELKEKNFLRTLVAGGLERNYSEYQLNRRYTSSGNTDAYW